jgi:hypothetical protein
MAGLMREEVGLKRAIFLIAYAAIAIRRLPTK